MSFSNTSVERFSAVFDKSQYLVEDPLVKIQYISRGQNVVFGRTVKGDNYCNLLYVGKILESTKGKSYLGADAWLDTTFPHVIYITGTRGSGKSFDLGVLVEGISKLATPSPVQNGVKPITSIIIDTQSQFWTLGYAPREAIEANKIQLQELNRWNLKPNNLAAVKVFTPPGSTQFLGTEKVLQIRPRDVRAEEWCALLGQEIYSPQGHIITATLEALGDRDFEIADMLAYIADAINWPTVAESSRNAITYKLDDYRRTNLFSAHGLRISDFLEDGVCNILSLRELRNEDKSLITAVIARNLFDILGRHHNKKKTASFFEKPFEDDGTPDRVWLVIDEAHVVAPRDQISPARDALVEYVKRGRDAGLSLVLATQQPSALDDRILSQVNVTFNHRLSFQSDINAAVDRIPTKSIKTMKFSGTNLTDFGDMVRVLDAGQCFLGDQASSRAVLVQIRPRVSAHGGYSPF
ncbi:DNA segregation ATPase FtsK/SpoIIIE and related proteins [Achromobacter xylosoxidans]|uniref:ATP-binding protein n=1 Tax=Alcaligenes xylosoxydans xylosoxydans TaxID=85698 RepID=UPI0006C716D4|nr:ATP-binding protein [Achromobacter xylosoxidans]CUJ18343.1 DNA segregation ATPase FtsK/SpoIIIE and related proteins [Achromobacter xylosoxidans]